MRFEIQQVVKSEPWQSQHGPMFGFTLAGLLDGQLIPNAQMNAKTAGAFVPGQVLDVFIDKPDAGYGPKLKKVPTATQQYPSQVPLQSAPAGVYAGPVASVPPSDLTASLIDPRQNSIERQSCLAQAVAYCSAKAAAYQAAKKPDEALKELTGEHILQVAQYFKKFVENGFKAKERTVEDIQAEPLPEEDPFADSEEYL